jgi:purine-nucleoside phosphorylase
VSHPADPWATADAAAERLAEVTGTTRHHVAVVLGSGWLPAAEQFGATRSEVGFADLPGFPSIAVEGHHPAVRSIEAPSGARILAFLGRVHGYEGHEPWQVVHGVRMAVRAGCSVVVLTNAAGGLRPSQHVGQPVLIADHLNLTGRSPLTGPASPPELGPRFVDLTDCWSPRLRALAKRIEPSLEEGVYAGLAGPQYETPAEVRMLQTLGADLVGMSTVLEAIAARHLGAEVLGMSLVTNLAAGMTGATLDHADVLAAGAAAAARMGALLAEVVAEVTRQG